MAKVILKEIRAILNWKKPHKNREQYVFLIFYMPFIGFRPFKFNSHYTFNMIYYKNIFSA